MQVPWEFDVKRGTDVKQVIDVKRGIDVERGIAAAAVTEAFNLYCKFSTLANRTNISGHNKGV